LGGTLGGSPICIPWRWIIKVSYLLVRHQKPSWAVPTTSRVWSKTLFLNPSLEISLPGGWGHHWSDMSRMQEGSSTWA
jgi:hypothetical protein